MPRETPEDRSKMPPEFAFVDGLHFDEVLGKWHVSVGLREPGFGEHDLDVWTGHKDAIAAAWAFVDRIRQEERERLAAAYIDRFACKGACCCTGACRPMPFDVAAWLRSGAKGGAVSGSKPREE